MWSVSGVKTFYDVLGVTKESSPDEIKSAYKKLALKYHPDRNPGDAASEVKFKEANEAYQVLGDDTKKAVYDFDHRVAEAAQQVKVNPRGPHINVQDLYSDMFKVDFGVSDFAPFAAPRKRPTTQEVYRKETPGDDVTVDIEITLEESISGCKKPVVVRGPRANVLCPQCNGSGSQPGTRRVTCVKCAGHGKEINQRGNGIRNCQICSGAGSVPIEKCHQCGGEGKVVYVHELVIHVPKGVATGQQIRVAGQGTPGHPPGSLFCNIKVSPGKNFWRENNDLHTTKRVSLRHVITGGQLVFLGPDGKEVHVHIPQGTQPGDTVRVPGQGVASPLSRVSGDLMVHIEVMLPRQMSPRAKKLLDELMEELGRGPGHDGNS